MNNYGCCCGVNGPCVHQIELSRQLSQAMATNDLPLAASLIRRGANVHALIENNPLLHYGILGGCFELVRDCLLYGADARKLDRDGDRMLHLAAEEGFLEAAALLLTYDDVNSSDRNGNTTLYYAMKNPDANMMDLLFRAGAHINIYNSQGDTPLHELLNRKASVWAVRKLIDFGAHLNVRNDAGRSPLDIALYRANGRMFSIYTPIIAELLTFGANIHEMSKTAFHFLVFYPRCNLQTVINLISSMPYFVNARDQFNCTPLFYAAESGRLDVVKELIRSGAEINATDNDGCTPLHFAIGNEQIVRELIINGAKVNKQNSSLETPLHLAARNHNETSGPVRVLLLNGADTQVIDIEGRTPFEYVCKRPNDPSMVLLLQYSFFENYTKERPYPHDKYFWLTRLRSSTLPLLLEIESMKTYQMTYQDTLYSLLMNDDWDVRYFPQIFKLMTPEKFPHYWEIVRSKLAMKVGAFMRDPYTDVQHLIRELSRKSSFITNIDCFLGIAQYLNNSDCLNFYLASRNSDGRNSDGRNSERV